MSHNVADKLIGMFKRIGNKESLEWTDPSLEATKNIPNQCVDNVKDEGWSHAGDNFIIQFEQHDSKPTSFDKLVDDAINPKF